MTHYKVTLVAVTHVDIPHDSPDLAAETALQVAAARWPDLRWLVSMTEEEL